MNAARHVKSALATVALASGLVACTDPSGDEPASADPTCRGGDASIVNSRGTQFPFEAVARGGPLIDRSVLVDLHPRTGALCVDIVVGHADPGSAATAYSLTVTKSGTTWQQEGTDPDEQDPLRVETRGCVDVHGSLTVLGAGDQEFEYRAGGRAGLGCARP